METLEAVSETTLFNADCFEIFPQIPDSSVDMVLTDPPYGCKFNDDGLAVRWEAATNKGPVGGKRPILNDGEEAANIFKKFLNEAARVLKPGCCCCCCCGGGGPDPLFAHWILAMNEVFDFKQMVIWDKGPMGMGWHYRRSYETILVAQKRGQACHWFDDSHKIENIIRPGDYGIKKIIPTKKQHPTTKPVALMEHFLQLHSRPGDVVLDPFMGGGTTGVACAKLKRRFIGIELDPEFFRNAESRIREAENNLQHKFEFAEY